MKSIISVRVDLEEGKKFKENIKQQNNYRNVSHFVESKIIEFNQQKELNSIKLRHKLKFDF